MKEHRIVSLLPSATEIACALGLSEQLVGITHCCDYPRDAIAEKPVVVHSAIPVETMSCNEIDIPSRRICERAKAFITSMNNSSAISRRL